MLTEEEICRQAALLSKAIVSAVKENRPDVRADAGEQAQILMTALAETVANCLLNVAMFTVTVDEIATAKGNPTKRRDPRELMHDVKGSLFSAISGLIDSIDLGQAEITLKLKILQQINEEKMRVDLEEDLSKSQGGPREKGPWSL